MKIKFQLLKERRKILKKRGKNCSEKASIWVNSPFSPAFLKKLQNEQIPNPKEKIYCTHILSSDLTINLLFNLVCFVLSVFFLNLIVYVYVTCVRSKYIKLKNAVRVGTSFFIFSPYLTSACFITSLKVYAVKKNRVDLGQEWCWI